MCGDCLAESASQQEEGCLNQSVGQSHIRVHHNELSTEKNSAPIRKL